MQTFCRSFLLIFFAAAHISAAYAIANPFHLPVELSGPSSEEKYVLMEQELRKLSVAPVLDSIYPSNGQYSVYGDFFGRTSVGIEACLLASEVLADGKRTQIIFKKIGKGADRCIVTYSTFNHAYAKSTKQMAQVLQRSGFNGYFLAFLGGYPNPTGQELQFAAVPYAFKIFMMKEAENLGFNHVLWIDGRCVPARDPTPIFKKIENKGSFFMGGIDACLDRRFMLPYTQQVIRELLGIDPLTSRKISGTVFGLKMNSPLTKEFIDLYYRLAREGTPFLSCFPEEFVISSIIQYLGRDKFVFSSDLPSFHKLLHWDKNLVDQAGYFFHHAPKCY